MLGLLDEFSDASVYRPLSELNTGTRWPAGDQFLERDRIELDRIEAFGLVNSLEASR